MDKEITITYETLFELLRREKSRNELQPLEKNFFENVADYIKEKKAILSRQNTTMFSQDEAEKVKVQLENVKRILDELYARREKKIVSLASIKARTGSDVINTSILHGKEAEFYNLLVELFKRFRNEFTTSIINGNSKEGFSELEKEPLTQEQKEQELKEAEKEGMIKEAESKLLSEEHNPEKKPENTEKGESQTKMVRFIHAVPKFLGKNLEVLGPFESEDIASLPAEIADVLINKGRAKEIKSD
ncbi:MAG: hypothetical protein D6797_05950 [Bdellovibrio sp.]|nr:MAG: hypothetical protein D6797_05950 [Bdellovibrio sp.]